MLAATASPAGCASPSDAEHIAVADRRDRGNIGTGDLRLDGYGTSQFLFGAITRGTAGNSLVSPAGAINKQGAPRYEFLPGGDQFSNLPSIGGGCMWEAGRFRQPDAQRALSRAKQIDQASVHVA